MHARHHGQGAAAAQARLPRSKLSDFFHLWVNNIRLLYTWSNSDVHGPLQLPSGAMGNLQSDGKRKEKRKKEIAPLPPETSSVAVAAEPDAATAVAEEPRKDNKRDQTPRAHDGRDVPRDTPIKIGFERMQTPGHAKRQAPQPPKVVLSKVCAIRYTRRYTVCSIF